jgi:AcrR family transcriptional regulator
MSPRPYRLGARQASIDETRRSILDAARSLLGDASHYTAFTVDAVAKAADVARATVYYQFESKTGLLEALCDRLSELGQIDQLGLAMSDPDPVSGLKRLVATFGRFWAADRVVMRRLRALAALDPEVSAVIAARDERRRQALQVMVARLDNAGGEQTVRLLHSITSFETFDTLAGADRKASEAIALATRLALAVVPAKPTGKNKRG